MLKWLLVIVMVLGYHSNPIYNIFIIGGIIYLIQFVIEQERKETEWT